MATAPDGSGKDSPQQHFSHIDRLFSLRYTYGVWRVSATMMHRMRILGFRCAAVLLCLCLALPPVANSQGLDEDVEALLARMSPAERVGQLFIVGFPGDLADQDSAIWDLVQDFRIGGVLLTARNQNFLYSEEKVVSLHALIAALQGAALSPSLIAGATPRPAAGTALPGAASTPEALASPSPEATPVPPAAETPEPGATPSPDETALPATPGPQEDSTPLPPDTTAEPTIVYTATATAQPTESTPVVRPGGGLAVPLFVAIAMEDMDWLAAESDSYLNLSMMTLGATWDAEAARESGIVMGRALRSLGVNMFFGPVADLANPYRAGLPGDLNSRSLGESPFWVGALASEYVDGLHVGSEGGVLSIAGHFPGWGASDRDVYQEAPVLQGSLETHLGSDLLPFRRLVSWSPEIGGWPVDGLLVSHVQFRGVTSATQMTRPASLDPQGLQYFLALPDVKVWRSGGGLTVTDRLGAPSLRQIYDPQMEDVQAKRIAYDAFLAGNDVLVLDAMGVDPQDWEGHFANVKDALDFFHSKYVSDAAFRSRVDDSVRRILAAKRRLYPRFVADSVTTPAQALTGWIRDWESLSEIASEAVTLLYPRYDEMLVKIPSPPGAADKIVIFEDVRLIAPCAQCEPVERPASGTTFRLLRDLYGQQGSGHLDMNRVRTYTFADLWEYLGSPDEPSEAARDLEQALPEAKWLLFISQDSGAARPPESGALSGVLQQKSALLQGKQIIVIACGAPYYLDSTDIAKVSAFYAVYSTARPAIEAGLRAALFREFVPVGVSPVSVPGIQFSISDRLQPSPDQILYAEPSGDAHAVASGAITIRLGDVLELRTGVIRDNNGNAVPDGTGVTFSFSYPAATIAWQQDAVTKGGRAYTAVRLDTPGTLEIRVASGGAKRTSTLAVTIEGDRPAVISTIMPTPAATAEATWVPTPAPSPPVDPPPIRESTSRSFDLPAFALTLSGLMMFCAAVWGAGYRKRPRSLLAEVSMYAVLAGLCGYLVYGFLAPSMENAAWFSDLRTTLSWRWQSALLSWLLAAIVAISVARRAVSASKSEPKG
jgi:beta-N-acetylhexosaminidase